MIVEIANKQKSETKSKFYDPDELRPGDVIGDYSGGATVAFLIIEVDGVKKYINLHNPVNVDHMSKAEFSRDRKKFRIQKLVLEEVTNG